MTAKNNFSHQVSKNILTGWLSIIILGVVSFIIAPILLNNFGKVVYGIWFMIFNFVGYFYLLDFGITTAVTRLYAKYRVLDSTKLKNLLGLAYLSLFLLSLLTLLVLYLIRDELFLFLEIETGYYKVFLLVYYAAIFEVCSQLILRINFAILKGQNKFHLSYKFEAVAALLRLLIVLIMVGFDIYNLTFFILTFAITKFLSDTISFVFVLDDLKGLSFRYGKEISNALFGMGVSTLFYSLMNIFIYAFQLFLFGKLFGIQNVFIYSLPFAILILLNRLITALFNSLIPRSSELKALQESADIFSLSKISVKFATLISFFVTITFIFFGKDLFYAWLGEDILDPGSNLLIYNIFILLLTFFIFESILKPNVFILRSTGLHWSVAFESFASAIILYLCIFLISPKYLELSFAISMSFLGFCKLYIYRIIARNNHDIYFLPRFSLFFVFLILITVYYLNIFIMNTILIKTLAYILVSLLASIGLSHFLFDINERKMIQNRLNLLKIKTLK